MVKDNVMFGQVMWAHWKLSIIRAGESAREGRSSHSVTEATLQASHITNHPGSKHQNTKTFLIWIVIHLFLFCQHHKRQILSFMSSEESERYWASLSFPFIKHGLRGPMQEDWDYYREAGVLLVQLSQAWTNCQYLHWESGGIQKSLLRRPLVNHPTKKKPQNVLLLKYHLVDLVTI